MDFVLPNRKPFSHLSKKRAEIVLSTISARFTSYE